MPLRFRNSRYVRARSLAVAIAALAVVASATPGAAQNIFQSLFGGRARVSAPVQVSNPFTSLLDTLSRPRMRTEVGGSRVFCVRTCDGRYFPIQAHSGSNPAQMCQAFCPASQTQVYSGGAIDHAVAGNGTRYADLDNAFAYRERIVDGCTCNGRDSFGLAQVDVRTDPTLRPGDIVAGKNGLAVFSAGKNKAAEFTPVESFQGFPKGYREKLSELKIMPPNPGAPNTKPAATPPSTTGQAPKDDDRRVQFSR